uniref:Uncharacterized protein n=1 Tax=Meloidogyne hapla TaxID=6305 RepID=A0A1I8B3S6_MELHA
MNSKNIFIPLLLFTSFLCVFAPGSYDEIDPYFASDPSKGLVDLEGVIEHDNARSEKLSVLRGFSPNKEKKRVQKKSCNTFSGDPSEGFVNNEKVKEDDKFRSDKAEELMKNHADKKKSGWGISSRVVKGKKAKKGKEDEEALLSHNVNSEPYQTPTRFVNRNYNGNYYGNGN